jgi:hypothetical protein
MNNTNNKIHLIPQPVIDCVASLNNTHQDHMRLNYIVRLEAIRDYCDQAIKVGSTPKQNWPSKVKAKR